jgi:predicted RNA-binding Zn ribbon-like protein
MTEVKYTLTMSWEATERYGARTAPAGLALVQDLVNTHAVERDGSDLLTSHASAQRWLRAATGQWASDRRVKPSDSDLSETDLQKLRDLRTTAQEMLAVPADQRPASMGGEPPGTERRTQVALVSDDEGRIAMVPFGTGASWLESAVWSEILLAQQTGAWSRLKLCREPGCRSAFYDTSRNGSGVWHNVRSCGNIANLHTSRARKKTRTAAHSSSGDSTQPANPPRTVL